MVEEHSQTCVRADVRERPVGTLEDGWKFLLERTTAFSYHITDGTHGDVLPDRAHVIRGDIVREVNEPEEKDQHAHQRGW